MQNITVLLNNDNSEKVPYNNPEIPIHASKAFVSEFPTICHWHDDFEFLLILSGRMNYNVNGKTYQLEAGNGIFTNSRQLHYEFCCTDTDCEYICVLLHPILLCANHFIEQQYVSQVMSNENFPYKLLFKSVKWEKDVLDCIKHIFDLELDTKPTYLLEIQSLFYKIFGFLFEYNSMLENSTAESRNQLSPLKDMIGYIQRNYSKKITLAEISVAGKICRSNCCKIFQEYLHTTPIAYLTEYRLNKSMDLLKNTDKSITEISYEVGFSGASYFTETFRTHMKCTPAQYRKMNK